MIRGGPLHVQGAGPGPDMKIQPLKQVARKMIIVQKPDQLFQWPINVKKGQPVLQRGFSYPAPANSKKKQVIKSITCFNNI